MMFNLHVIQTLAPRLKMQWSGALVLNDQANRRSPTPNRHEAV